MRSVLILGGTRFIGKNLVKALEFRTDCEITLFNRNQSQSFHSDTARLIKGDRQTTDIKQIAERAWDLVIDLSCYFPADLQSVIEQLNPIPKHYLFVSTCSVYDNELHQDLLRSEDAPLLTCTSEEAVSEEASTYGRRKAACERLLINSGIPFTIFRPALVFGPHDYTDRFYYWLYQHQHIDSLLIPDHGARVFSLTYVQDLVNLLLTAMDRGPANRAFNAVSYPLGSIASILDELDLIDQTIPKRVNVEPGFLHQQKIAEWMDMPLWLDRDYFTYSNQAIKDYYQFEPISFSEAINQTQDYFKELEWPIPEFGMSEETRRAILRSLL